jgi:[glutamine synthetase] adenylyltransferase / [glutamine synthetase]-adenylyl-L-tyrosine phosphorylase
MHPGDPVKTVIDSILPYSRYAQHMLASEPELRVELEKNLHRPFLACEMRQFLDENADIANDEAGLQRILRRLRKKVMLRLIARDLGGLADLAEVMTSMTELGEIAIRFALERQQAWLTDTNRYGYPRNREKDISQEMLVVAMGKLGGRELNVSSDVDLIFVYPEDGETDGRRSISNQDFFIRLGRRLIASLNDMTPDGYVFRVDMRLRPYGESGPLAMSFPMLKDYFINQGREWERYAWIKSRVVAGPRTEGSVLMEQIAQPFVFRKYPDFGAYESMRGLYSQIRQEVGRRELHENIKLGPGGIREIEFIAQVFQLIRGGRDADLRVRPTLEVLQRLREKRQLSEKAVAELSEAYHFFRDLEHRLQYLDDLQTQTLPKTAADQALIGEAMGFSSYQVFLERLNDHRGNVTGHFEHIFAAPREFQTTGMVASLWEEQAEEETGPEAAIQLGAMGFSDPQNSLGRLQAFRASTRYRQLPKPSKARIDALVPALIEVAAKMPSPDATLERLLGLLESVSRRAAYIALLREYPEALERVAKLVSTSQWASEYLSTHPILLDELLDPGGFQNAPDWSRSKAVLDRQLKQAGELAGSDTEQQMDVLRHFHHAQVFQLLARDVEGLLPLETLSDHLTELADLILDKVLQLAWSGLRRRHREEPAFAVVGYGKLGGKELGYASDLDIIFLYDDPHPDAPEIYARLSQRINSWLTSYTSAGLLYETDLRLRPNGSSGLLVSSLDAFDQYQRNQAWVWEHQALTRARFVAGNPQIGGAFEQTRKEVLRQRRDLAKLKREVLAMREKMFEAHPNSSRLFDVKHDRGGIIDVEFIVQYLILGHACDHPELTDNIGNIALLKLVGELRLVSAAAAQQVLVAYREFRRVQHRLRLSGNPGVAEPSSRGYQKFVRVEADHFKGSIAAVLQLWAEVFD